MNTDIEIEYVAHNVKVEVVYDGKTTVIKKCLSAILKCAEKAMKSNIEIMASILNTYNITTVYSDCFGYSTNPTEIIESEEVTIYFKTNEGYSAPESVYVSGAEYSYIPFSDNSGGSITIINPTNTVYISVSASNLIKFTIDGKMYYAECDMTFSNWVESQYNTDGFYVGEYYVYTSDGMKIDGYDENPNDGFLPDPYEYKYHSIIDGANYTIHRITIL